MALEDRGVDKETFIELQEKSKALIYHSKDSLEHFSQLLKKYNLGGNFHLESILEHLNKLGLDFKEGTDKKAIGGAFFERLLRYSMNHSLREIKFKARIPVPNSYQLVGVADEGRAYIKDGIASEDDVYTLGHNMIYGASLRIYSRTTAHRRQHPLSVCVQNPANEQPIYLKGKCVISRSPVIHPGDGT
jgi:RNA-dependent RNA polymerase